MDTRLRNLLHDLASEMPVELERSAPPTLRKARGRRALTGAGAVVAVIAFVAVSVSAIRLASDPEAPVPTTTGPNPATFQGLWPETSPDALETAQEAIDEGHMPLRTTPDGTATLFATNLLGWQLDDVRAEVSQERDDHAIILLSNAAFDESVPPVVVGLRQLGDTGPNGVWSVVEAGNMLVEPIEYDRSDPALVHVSGEVPGPFDGAPTVEANVFDGPTAEPSLGSARSQLTGGRFAFDIEVSLTPDGSATLLLTNPDALGQSLGAALMPIRTPMGATPSEPSVNVEGVPPDVAATAQQIYDAAKAKDFDALAELLDPVTFIYNLGDASDPIPEWRANPSELDVMVEILEMPPTSREIGPGYGTYYFWPYLVNSDFENLTPQERADLAALGYSDEDITLIIDGGTGYQGPRLAIDENGEWRNFITVGE
ncbi:MAG TPA: hypothetical protein VF028_05665 [Actinomycetota bacterium]|nr:hypothetical protein [Actinomycetota bacterium]